MDDIIFRFHIIKNISVAHLTCNDGKKPAFRPEVKEMEAILKFKMAENQN